MTLKILKEQPWYAHGLRFECTGCGQCCTGSPGHTWVTVDEIEAMAKYLQISLDDFARRFIRRVNGRFSLLDDPQTYACVFLKDKKCQIYPARPTQCRTFPWWAQNLESEQAWQEAAIHCEGIRADAPLVPIEMIENQLLINHQ